MKEIPTYTPDFEEYIRQGEPDKKERAQIWRTAIGLQQVDGLEVSDYLKELAKRDIEGEISLEELTKLLNEYHRSKRSTCKRKKTTYSYERQYNPVPRTTRERIIGYLRGRPWADNKQLSYVLHISMSTVRYHLRKLQKEGIIVCSWDPSKGRCRDVINC